MLTILQGDCLEKLRELPDESVHCCVTSPPYLGLRDYGVEGQIGLEPTVEEFIARLVAVFAEVRRVLRKDGTCWVNMGDSYNAQNSGNPNGLGKRYGRTKAHAGVDRPCRKATGVKRTLAGGLKAKDLIGQPWRLAFALQSEGWYLRQDIIWHKPNPMPESIADRCTKAHEYLFLLSKSERYFYDQAAIRENVTGNAHSRGSGVNQKIKIPNGWDTSEGGHGAFHPEGRTKGTPRPKQNASFSSSVKDLVDDRNKRSVWTVPTYSFPEAHFATYPPDLIKPCILAGTSSRGVCSVCGSPQVREIESEAPKHADGESKTLYPAGSTANRLSKLRQAARARGEEYHKIVRTLGWKPSCFCEGAIVPATVLDPFGGSGTTGQVALELGRNAILIELNPDYIPLIEKRTQVTRGLPL